MSSLPQGTRFRLNVSASHVVVLFGLLLMKFATSAPAPTAAVITLSSPSTTISSVYSSTAAAAAGPIFLFEDKEFKGIRSRLYVGLSTCVNLIGKLNDFFSSVDAMDGCYLLCEHQNCRGKCERVTGKVKHLSRLGLNDAVSSLRVCGDANVIESSAGTSNGRRRDNSGIIRSASSSSSPMFLRQRFRRSVKWKEQEAGSVSSSFSSNPKQWRTMRIGTRTLADQNQTSSDNSGTVTSSYPLIISSIKNDAGTIERSSSSAEDEVDIGRSITNRNVIQEETGRNPHLRLLRIRRHRRKRRGLNSEKVFNIYSKNVI